MAPSTFIAVFFKELPFDDFGENTIEPEHNHDVRKMTGQGCVGEVSKQSHHHPPSYPSSCFRHIYPNANFLDSVPATMIGRNDHVQKAFPDPAKDKRAISFLLCDQKATMDGKEELGMG
ncbi:hypothetical protein N7457_004635 [Penicillium paradoxum]|uniref:uncharacterized protein n=1 Tax=Penicillium paradoxum TaxID=176176 RepID=UPI0025478FFB|nr:uncharacterized protein N7457_004635 [Penicillium paradoxum]KAJ5782861.1 hypothetical protein N7457_004635 [Penicillium paradoxum]